jgi:hypothetical protein
VRQCDIRERGCQRNTMEAVACLRGGSLDRVPEVSVISEEQFVERVSAYGDDGVEAKAEREAAYLLWTRGLALYALAPGDYDTGDAIADSAAGTAAAYFPEQGDVVIIDRGEALNDEGAVEVFAHEIVHALQDRELDLMTFGQDQVTSFDSSLALDALIEGEATHYQILVAVELAGRTPDRLDWEALYRSFRGETLFDADADEAPVAMAGQRFPYAFGGGFVSQHWLARGRAGVDQLFESPPRTSSEIMFGFEASAFERERAALDARAVPELPEPFEEQAATALGAWIARMYAARAGEPVEARLEPARNVGADVFSVHHDADDDTIVAAWRARMREGTSPSAWPAPANPAAMSALDEVQREATQLASEAELPSDAAMLAWHESVEREEDEQSAAASSGELPEAAWRHSGVRACGVRRAPLWWRP